MAKITIKTRNALKSALYGLMELSKNILVYGVNHATQDMFCKPINIAKAYNRLLSCTSMEIHQLGYYVEVEKTIVEWLKNHIRCPTETKVWWSMVSPGNWIKYNIDKDLYILRLGVGTTYYYIVIRREILTLFRQQL